MANAITPRTIGESLMYAVKRVEGMQRGSVVSYGTGWAFRMVVDESNVDEINMIITNLHVVAGMDQIRIQFHTKTNGELDGDTAFLTVDKDDVFSEQDGPDIALIFFGRQLTEWVAQNPGRGLFWVPVGAGSLIPEATERELDACEPVLMVGCPSGLWDEENGFPLFRRGVTASHPAIDFGGKPEFAIDIGVYSGSSGSPVILWDTGLIKLDKTKNNLSPGSRFWVLGMLWGGPRITENGELKVEPVPSDTRVSVTTNVRMHLGYVIKAREVRRIVDLAFADITAAARRVGRIA